MDKIKISNLIIFAKHGVFQEEKNLGQKFLLDIELRLDCQKAGLTGDLNKSVHYGFLANQVTEVFTKTICDLIESAGEEVASFILKTYPQVKSLSLRVKKPWAPVGLPLDTVYVELERERKRAFIGIGSNMGDSLEIIKRAEELIESPYVKIIKSSSLITTKAWGLENQADFKNKVIEIESFLNPEELLDHLQKIEIELGRERKIHWGPRTIDLDILFIEDMKIYTDRLIVPHPYVHERAFVLESLNEIAPFYTHPILNKQIRELYTKVK